MTSIGAPARRPPPTAAVECCPAQRRFR